MIVLDISDAYANDKNIPYVGHCGGTCMFLKNDTTTCSNMAGSYTLCLYRTSFLISECRHIATKLQKSTANFHAPTKL